MKMKTIKLLLKGAALILVLFYLFKNANFSDSQSLFLSLVVVVVVGYIQERTAVSKEQKEFRPFAIRISPNWRELLKDYGLFSEEKWKKIQNKSNNQKSDAYNVYTKGISFTMVQPELVFINDHNEFATRVDISERMEELKDGPGFLDYTPRFYIKNDWNGYDIGVTTPESYHKSHMAGDDLELIKVATIPYGLFKPYFGHKLTVNEHKKLEKSLKDEGWKREEYTAEDSLINWPQSITHKYFIVYYTEI